MTVLTKCKANYEGRKSFGLPGLGGATKSEEILTASQTGH